MNIECPCDRCSGIGPTCEVCDHRYGNTGATCQDCGEVNGGLLAWFRFEKAEREGRACVDHFHRTQAAKDRCKTPKKYPDLVAEDEE